MSKTTIMIPTYNERGNISRLIESILSLKVAGQEIHVLVVDDNSPDGTGEAVAEYAAKNSKVRLITRKNERGRGSAGIVGFKEALASDSDFVIEMDADFSHDPKYIPELLNAAASGADVVLGSRFVEGGSDDDRGPYRQVVTKLAGFYVRTLLGLKVRDVSSGYRCFRRNALKQIGLDNLISTGPSIVLEILYKCSMKGFKIVEVPIVFIDRRIGVTKLNSTTLIKTSLMVLRFRELKRRGRLFPAA
ncbi:MAG: polyprenol monophosphomannose synthase [Bdellovibrionota bacterium]